MALSGKLDELSPSEVFQLISLTRKTGMLAMSRSGRHGVVVFKEGRIVFAASDRLRSTFEETLRHGQVVTDEAIVQEAKRRGLGSVSDSGAFLVELRETEAGSLEEVVRKQIETTVRELVTWRSGTFVFDSVDLPITEEMALDTGKFLDVGVSSEELLLNALAKLDESERGRWKQDLDAAAAAPIAEPAAQSVDTDISAVFQLLVDESTGRLSWIPAIPPSPEPARDLANLRRLVPQLKDMPPSLTAETTLLILRFAAQMVNRGVLFAVTSEGFQGVGQFGLEHDIESPDDRVRSLCIPRHEPSFLAQVTESGSSYRGVMPQSRCDSFIATRLGSGLPGQVVAVPLVIDGDVVAVFYGDNLPDSTRVCAVDGLEILMYEIGLGVEKARLQRRLQELNSSS